MGKWKRIGKKAEMKYEFKDNHDDRLNLEFWEDGDLTLRTEGGKAIILKKRNIDALEHKLWKWIIKNRTL